jgi:hypothetical protein
METAQDVIDGVADGVPYRVIPPPAGSDRATAPLVLAWHLNEPPRSHVALAAALPLTGLPAWRVYVGLPLSGSRLPGGTLDGFFALAYEDAVLKVFEPTVSGAVEELPGVLSHLRSQLGIGGLVPIGLLGGSIGAGVAETVLAETDLPVAALVLVSPLVQLRRVVAMNERRFDLTYPWSSQGRLAADRLDVLARLRSTEVARRWPPTLIITGADDEAEILEPADELAGQLKQCVGADAVGFERIAGMGHSFAEEPGLEPAPQTIAAAQIDPLAADWFRGHLQSPRRQTDS